VEELLPRLHGGQVMVTSRLSDCSGSVDPFELELLSEKAAVEFLLERTKNRRVNDASDGDKVRELANLRSWMGSRWDWSRRAHSYRKCAVRLADTSNVGTRTRRRFALGTIRD
jgi:hypothetical protein